MTETLVVESRLIKHQGAALKQYVSLLIRLHEAMRTGDEEEAERIREQMDAPGLLLNEDEIRLVKGVSSDLYMLSGEEVLRPSGYSKEEVSARLVSAYNSRDADAVLTLLRKTERPAPDSGAAYARSIAYGRLGLEEASRVFLLHASKLDPENVGYRVNILIELSDRNQVGPIRSLAMSVFNNSNASPHSVLMAAGALFFMSEDASTDAARIDLGQAWRKLREMLEKSPPERLSVEDSIFSLLLVGGILSALGRKSKAREAFEEAARSNVMDSMPWVALGISWFKDDPKKSALYFKRAVELETENPFPYLALATYALTRRDYQEAKRSSKKLLEKIQENGGPASSPRLSAQVYELLGLIEDEQNGPTDAAINYLNEATHLDPENERIQAHYTGLLRESQTREMEIAHIAERHQRLSDWAEALQRDAPSPTSMLLPTLGRPTEGFWGPQPLAFAA